MSSLSETTIEIPVQSQKPSKPRTFIYHVHTVWLFAHDQIFDTIIPVTTFAIICAKASLRFDLPQQPLSATFHRTILAAAWVWLVILQFCIHNQRHPLSIKEDAINKPWWPFPAKRTTVKTANLVLLLAMLALILMSSVLNVFPQSAMFYILTVGYNDFGLSEHGGLSRNLLNATGFTCLLSGALQIAIGSKAVITSAAWAWTVIISLVLFTTIHAQEFRDEEGYRARGRRTIITEIGSVPARWLLVTAVVFWSMYIPWWLGVSFFWCGLSLSAWAMLVGMNLEAMRRGDIKRERQVYRVWCVWILGLCILPLALF